MALRGRFTWWGQQGWGWDGGRAMNPTDTEGAPHQQGLQEREACA